MRFLRIAFQTVLILFLLNGLASCKAKSCDSAANVSDNGKSRKKVKHIGLFSRKERRRKKW